MTPTLPLAPAPAASTPRQPTRARHPLAELQARAKAIRKFRKHESRRVFHGFCWCLHAIGFSF